MCACDCAAAAADLADMAEAVCGGDEDLAAAGCLEEGAVFGADGRACTMEWSAYARIYLDANGSLAFWNRDLAQSLSDRAVVRNIRGAVVRGALADEAPAPAASPRSMTTLVGCALQGTIHLLVSALHALALIQSCWDAGRGEPAGGRHRQPAPPPAARRRPARLPRPVPHPGPRGPHQPRGLAAAAGPGGGADGAEGRRRRKVRVAA